jgi:N-acetylmuramoyl-L-alanine amidase
MAIKIVLDPGHGKTGNPGIIKGFYEGTNNWEAVEIIRNRLLQYEDVEVVTTRPSIEDNPGTDTRGIVGQNADLFYSWHSNGFSSDKAYGVSGFYSIYNSDTGLVKQLCENCVEFFSSYLRGITTRLYPDYPDRDYYGVIRNSTLLNGNKFSESPNRAPCSNSIIVEHGFHSNYVECDMLNNPSILTKMCECEADIIADYFGLKLKKTTTTYYAVQVGSFKNKYYAESMLKTLEEDGYNGYIVKKEL